MSATTLLAHTADGLHIGGTTDHTGRILRRVGVAIASETSSEAAAAASIAAALRVNGDLLVVHVRPSLVAPPPMREDEGLSIDLGDAFAETAEEAAAVTNAVVRAAHARGVRAIGVVLDAPRALIAPSVLDAAAGWQADLLVIARRQRHAISRLLFGSISDLIVRGASCPVLLVRSP